MKAAIFLLGAIIFEVIGTTMLNLSDGFTNILPTVNMYICFALSFVCLIGALNTIPLSIAYSVWAGLRPQVQQLLVFFYFRTAVCSKYCGIICHHIGCYCNEFF